MSSITDTAAERVALGKHSFGNSCSAQTVSSYFPKRPSVNSEEIWAILNREVFKADEGEVR
ncbi:hypothetical protein PR048_024766 [Dryococelus australis]|uniref:Uncharacterized protein n=1 Tax=Dryococelus australis TaxID=614101 RepID=A0ABQ9GPK6_9NEOP|nr:hypothetical protein PR048_024766 [Dryococelus australis]